MFQIKSPFGSKYFWVPNYIVDHYFHDTDAESIKLFIFLLRMADSQDHYSPKLLGNILSMSEDHVIHGLQLWEQRKLLYIEYENADISKVYMNPFFQIYSSEEEANAVPPNAAYIPQMQQPTTVAPSTEKAQQAQPTTSQRPQYQPTQLLKMQEEHSEYQLLLYTVRKLLDKELTANDISILFSLHDWLKLPFEIIQTLIVYCAEHGKKDFSYIEVLAVKLAEKGVTLPEQVEAFLSPPSEKYLYEVIRELGMGGSTPTEGQRELYKKWTEVYRFSHETVLRGCHVASTKSNRTSFQYLDAILTNWFKEGAIDGVNNKTNGGYDSDKRNTETTAPIKVKPKGPNAFHNFPNAATNKYAEAIEKLINEDFGRYE